MNIRELINIVEGDVIPFSRPLKKTKDSLRDFMSDTRPIEQKYQVGDVLQHVSSKEIVEVLDKEDSPVDPILTVKIRSNGTKGRFFASEFDPAPLDHW